MIKEEIVEINGKEFKHTYSDANLYIMQEVSEVIYEEAYDLVDSTFSYVETTIPIRRDEKTELKLTRGDVFRGLLQAKGILRSQIRALIEASPSETTEEALIKELALIDFDEALYFYRRNPLIDQVGLKLGISNSQMNRFFRTNDWHELIR